MEATKKLEDKMDDVASELKAMVGDLDERLSVVECYVNEQRSKKAQDRGASSFTLTPTSRSSFRTPVEKVVVEDGSEEEDDGDADEENDEEENDEEENDEEENDEEENDEEDKDENDEEDKDENDEEEKDESGADEDNDEEDKDEEEQVAEPMTKKIRNETPAEEKQRLSKRAIKPSAAVSSPFVPGGANGRGKGKGKTTGKAAGETTRRYNTRRKNG